MRFRTETITDVPGDQLAMVTVEEQDSDPKPTRVQASPDGKGTFTVTSFFPIADASAGGGGTSGGGGGTSSGGGETSGGGGGTSSGGGETSSGGGGTSGGGGGTSGGGGGTSGGGGETSSGGGGISGGGGGISGGTSSGGGHALNHFIPTDVIAAAQASQTKWSVPASVTIAQWALESGWGRHMPSGSNNPFGIKAIAGEPFVTASTREFINNQLVTVDQNFRKYDSIADAFDAHAKLLATAPAYAAARAFTSNLSAYVSAMAKVYATAPDYGSNLLALIHGDNLVQFDSKPASATGIAAKLLAICGDTSQLQRCQKIAAKKLLDFDGEVYPSDGCAITLSIIFQQAGVALPDLYKAIDVGPALKKLGWQQVDVGHQKAGDVGSTCGNVAQHGVDHIYIVVLTVNNDEMIVADNQQQEPHTRWASGKGRSPTTFFLRMPSA